MLPLVGLGLPLPLRYLRGLGEQVLARQPLYLLLARAHQPLEEPLPGLAPALEGQVLGLLDQLLHLLPEAEELAAFLVLGFWGHRVQR